MQQGKGDQSYWLNRWERGDTGWHQDEVEPALVSCFAGLSPTRVLVPLCGKSVDLHWLASQGHEVIGVELSLIACQQFFSGRFHCSDFGAFRVYRALHESHSHGERSKAGVSGAGSVTLFNGDFFQFMPADLGELGAIYDRAALIALPLEVRRQYAEHLKGLMRACSKKTGIHFLQVVLERKPPDEKGPPFSVSHEEIIDHYGSVLEITSISREKVNMGNSSSAQTEECVYLLRSPP